MAVDMNALKSMLNKGGGAGGSADLMNSPYRNLGIAAVVGIAFIVAFVFLFYLPYREENAKHEAELKQREKMQNEFGSIDSQAKNIQNKLSKSKEYYADVLTYFGNSQDLRDLYQSVSLVAGRNNMIVFNIKQIPIPEADDAKKKKGKKGKNDDAKDDSKDDSKKDAKKEEKKDEKKDAKAKDGKEAKPEKKIIDEIRVSLELKGTFPNYLNFKQALSEAPLLLSIHSELVKTEETKKEKDAAATPANRDIIFVTLELSSYAINKDEYFKALESYEKDQNAPVVEEQSPEEQSTEDGKEKDTTETKDAHNDE
jgi:hypothetical protein